MLDLGHSKPYNELAIKKRKKIKKEDTKMKKVEFSKNDNHNYDVFVEGSRYGRLAFDKEHDAWDLWTIDGSTDVLYFEDLKETQATIIEEMNNFEDENFLN